MKGIFKGIKKRFGKNGPKKDGKPEKKEDGSTEKRSKKKSGGDESSRSSSSYQGNFPNMWPDIVSSPFILFFPNLPLVSVC